MPAIGEHGRAELAARGAAADASATPAAWRRPGSGTALGVVYAKAAAGEPVEVFACETRPLLQGARLTAWELERRRHPGDRAARRRRGGAARARAAIDAVIVGCDRVAANGDVANKIGTYALAIAARHHGVPFYVAGPRSTLDPATAERRRDRDRAARRRRGPRVAGLDDDARSGTPPSTSPRAELDHRR